MADGVPPRAAATTVGDRRRFGGEGDYGRKGPLWDHNFPAATFLPRALYPKKADVLPGEGAIHLVPAGGGWAQPGK